MTEDKIRVKGLLVLRIFCQRKHKVRTSKIWIFLICAGLFLSLLLYLNRYSFFMFIFIKYGNTVSMNGGKLECAD